MLFQAMEEKIPFMSEIQNECLITETCISPELSLGT